MGRVRRVNVGGMVYHGWNRANFRSRLDGLIHREAFTLSSAQAIRDYLANECGLRLDLEDVPEPGRLVFIYKRAPVATR